MVDKATGILRDLQLVEVEILSDFKKLCNKHNLRYYLDCGTLLGAVRHKGFIPWDDDIDVTMPYADYLKFLDIAQNEFGNKYFLQTSDTDINYYRSYARIRKNETTCVDKHQIEWDIHHGIWIDIFPIVEINSGFEFKFKKTIMAFSNFILMDQYFEIHKDEFTNKIGKLGFVLVKWLHKIPRDKRVVFKKWLQRCIFEAKGKKSISEVWMTIDRVLPAETYEQSCKLVFEDDEYDVPYKYKEVLKITFGDYMKLPPLEQRKGHGSDMIIDVNNSYEIYKK